MSLERHEHFDCPYCGADNGLPVDLTGGREQRFVVDCEACCAPIVIRMKIQGREFIELDVRRENE